MANHESPKNSKRKGTKAALAASFAALLLCGATLVGTTFAWFTDTASTGSNKIQAGELDVDLLMWDGDSYESIANEESVIFGGENSLVAQNNNQDTLWEPGKTQVAYLAIKNEGNLALKYNVALNTINPTEDEKGNAIDSKDLYKAMRYEIIPDAKDGDITAWNTTNTAKRVNEGLSIVSNGEGHMTKDDVHYFALAVHMDENAGNEYQKGQVQFDLSVLATQDTVEADSFSNQYDANAGYAVGVSNEQEFRNAVQLAQEQFSATTPFTIYLDGDVVLSAPVDINQANIVLDMRGHTMKTSENFISSTHYTSNIYVMLDVYSNDATLTITGNGTFEATKGTHNIIAPRGTINIMNGRFINSEPHSNSGLGSSSLFIGVRNQKLTIYDGYFDSNTTATDREWISDSLINATDGQAIEILGGTFVKQDPRWRDPNNNFTGPFLLKGQTEDEKAPTGYEIKEGTTTDGTNRKTYTVIYNGN